MYLFWMYILTFSFPKFYFLRGGGEVPSDNNRTMAVVVVEMAPCSEAPKMTKTNLKGEMVDFLPFFCQKDKSSPFPLFWW